MGFVRALDRLDRTLGMFVARVAGLLAGAFAFGLGRACLSAVETSQWGAAAALGVGTLVCAALTWALFKPGRRLSDIEP